MGTRKPTTIVSADAASGSSARALRDCDRRDLTVDRVSNCLPFWYATPIPVAFLSFLLLLALVSLLLLSSFFLLLLSPVSVFPSFYLLPEHVRMQRLARHVLSDQSLAAERMNKSRMNLGHFRSIQDLTCCLFICTCSKAAPTDSMDDTKISIRAEDV